MAWNLTLFRITVQSETHESRTTWRANQCCDLTIGGDHASWNLTHHCIHAIIE